MTFILDIDLTICKAINRDYKNAIPYSNVINKINHLYKNGHHIVLFTARGMLSNNNDIHKINETVRPVLELWLNKHNVMYHELIMGKPFFSGETYYIGDEVLTISQFINGTEHEYKDFFIENNKGKE